jgi:hypothetical protein
LDREGLVRSRRSTIQAEKKERIDAMKVKFTAELLQLRQMELKAGSAPTLEHDCKLPEMLNPSAAAAASTWEASMARVPELTNVGASSNARRHAEQLFDSSMGRPPPARPYYGPTGHMYAPGTEPVPPMRDNLATGIMSHTQRRLGSWSPSKQPNYGDNVKVAVPPMMPRWGDRHGKPVPIPGTTDFPAPTGVRASPRLGIGFDPEIRHEMELLKAGIDEAVINASPEKRWAPKDPQEHSVGAYARRFSTSVNALARSANVAVPTTDLRPPPSPTAVTYGPRSGVVDEFASSKDLRASMHDLQKQMKKLEKSAAADAANKSSIARRVRFDRNFDTAVANNAIDATNMSRVQDTSMYLSELGLAVVPIGSGARAGRY